jgi:4-hydroxy-tetrahydrodipicolinate synthase
MIVDNHQSSLEDPPMSLRGVFSAVATPFTADEEIDESRLRDLVEATITGGIHGLVPNGSTGEFQAQTLAERRRVAEIVIEQTAGRVPVMPHVGALRTSEAVGLAQHAVQSGASAVMAVAPFYEPLELDELKSYYRTVADSVSVPVMIYNLPVATGVVLSAEDLASIASESENIKYVKDTTGDFAQAVRLIHDYKDVLTAFVGMDSFFMANFLEGGAGTIVGATNFMTPQLISIYDAIQDGDYVTAKAEWEVVFPVMQFLVSGGYVAGVKGALDLLGISAGPARAPIGALPEERRQELESLLKNAGISR